MTKNTVENARESVALGTNAVLAIAGASESIRNWDTRLAHHGSVPVKETRALKAETVERVTIDAAFAGPLLRNKSAGI